MQPTCSTSSRAPHPAFELRSTPRGRQPSHRHARRFAQPEHRRRHSTVASSWVECLQAPNHRPRLGATASMESERRSFPLGLPTAAIRQRPKRRRRQPRRNGVPHGPRRSFDDNSLRRLDVVFSKERPDPEKEGSPVVSGDLICVGGHGLWTLPRLWKTPETPGERGV